MPKTQTTTTKKTATTKKKPLTSSLPKRTIPSKAPKLPSKTSSNVAPKAPLISHHQLLSHKETNKIPNWVWIFFGCSLLLFCTALYRAVLRPNNLSLLEPTIPNEPSLTETEMVSEEPTTEEVGSDGNVRYPPVIEETLPEVTLPEEEPTAQVSGIAFLQQFYQVFSQRDITTLRNLMDTPLQKSADMKRFFSDYKITPFLDNIEHHQITPYNISLVDTSPSGVEEYSYMIGYHLIPQNINFEEQRIAKIRYTES
ncbi:MAG: hypothetical protein LBP53_04830 [Candidatus Peribacteria bacterium]|nr:hypothetical protein [Candidatus Peribacteria bacterium]